MQIVEGKDCFVEFNKEEKDGLIEILIHVKPKEENSSVKGSGHYKRIYEISNFHEKHNLNFMNKFLRDSEYRKQFFRGGVEWEGIILSENLTEFDKTEKDLTKVQENSKIENNSETIFIHPKCAEAIVRLNRMNSGNREELDKSLRKLKSFKDGFSDLEEDELVLMVSKEAIEKICQNDKISEGSKEFKDILQWIARGLKPELAIYKILNLR